MTVISAFVPFLIMIIVFWGLSRLVIASADFGRTAAELGGGQLQFILNRRAFWGMYGFIALMLYVIGMTALHGLQSPVDWLLVLLWGGFLLLLIASFPGTIVAGPDGITQTFWLANSRTIPWNDVKQVRIDQKKQRVQIVGKTGKKISHMRQLPDREKFLSLLNEHCPEPMARAEKLNGK